MHRFIPAIASIQGINLTEIEVRHHYRRHGKSKYGFSRIWKVLFDLIILKLIIHFEIKPFHWFVLASIGPFILSIFFALLSLRDLLYAKLSYSPVVHFGMCFLFFMLFCHLIIMGFVSELIRLTGLPPIPKMLTEWTSPRNDT
jgi:hypothetical protein